MVDHPHIKHRGRRDDPLYRIRRTLLVGSERLNERGWTRLIAGLEAADPDGHLAASWLAKEELRRVYSAKGPVAARAALTRVYLHCADRSHVPEVLTLAKTPQGSSPAARKCAEWERSAL